MRKNASLSMDSQVAGKTAGEDHDRGQENRGDKSGERSGRNNPQTPEERNPGADENRPEINGDEADEEEEALANPRPKPAKRQRQGSQHRPTCPNCSTPDQPAVCVAGSSHSLITYYYCPQRCGFSVSLPRPDISAQLRRQQAGQTGFAAR